MDKIILLENDGILIIPFNFPYYIYIKEGTKLIIRISNIEHEIYHSHIYDRVIEVRDYLLNSFLKNKSIIDLNEMGN